MIITENMIRDILALTGPKSLTELTQRVGTNAYKEDLIEILARLMDKGIVKFDYESGTYKTELRLE